MPGKSSYAPSHAGYWDTGPFAPLLAMVSNLAVRDYTFEELIRRQKPAPVLAIARKKVFNLQNKTASAASMPGHAHVA